MDCGEAGLRRTAPSGTKPGGSTLPLTRRTGTDARIITATLGASAAPKATFGGMGAGERGQEAARW
ncbi:hypothetical protein GCM10009754_77430 [Amycolatopsis minnesotensis]|uniref:Uncharacterized protein n=1 Tax=Amycolatopsis minnesotensis TaxID=337894 RepID=A0ABN2SJK5_9PSEU